MTKQELDNAGRKLYNACPTVKPTWDQLGDKTKELWMERAQAAAERESHVELSKPE